MTLKFKQQSTNFKQNNDYRRTDPALNKGRGALHVRCMRNSIQGVQLLNLFVALGSLSNPLHFSRGGGVP